MVGLSGAKPGLSLSIPEDRPCLKCNYNLKGLKIGERCPECGTPIHSGRVYSGGNMTEAPVSFLAAQARAATGLFAGGVGIVIVGAVAIIVYPLAGATLGIGAFLLVAFAAVVWGLSVHVLTKPRELGTTTSKNLEKEWKPLRMASRWSQWGWAAVCFFVFLAVTLAYSKAAAVPTTAPLGTASVVPIAAKVFIGMASVALLVAAIGIMPCMIHLSLLSDWADDTTLSQRLRVVPVVLACEVPVACFVIFIAARFFAGTLGFLSFTAGGLMLMVVIAGLAFSAWTLWQFSSLCVWATKNTNMQLDSDKRRNSRIVKRIEDGVFKTDPKEKHVTKVNKPAKQQGYVLPSTSSGEAFDLAEPDNSASKNKRV